MNCNDICFFMLKLYDRISLFEEKISIEISTLFEEKIYFHIFVPFYSDYDMSYIFVYPKQILQNMYRFGGSFVQSLAFCYSQADPDNQETLYRSFEHLFIKYANFHKQNFNFLSQYFDSERQPNT